MPPGTPDTMATTGHLRGVSARFAKLPPSDVAPDACRTKGRTAGRCHRGVLPGGLGDARGSSEEAVLEICENEKSLDCECVSLGSDKRFFEVFRALERRVTFARAPPTAHVVSSRSLDLSGSSSARRESDSISHARLLPHTSSLLESRLVRFFERSREGESLKTLFYFQCKSLPCLTPVRSNLSPSVCTEDSRLKWIFASFPYLARSSFPRLCSTSTS